jgi:anti-sigma regulatory factor (Ser/Thr protein kinase)
VRLAAAQWLARDGTPRRPMWRPGVLRQVVIGYALDGLDEGRAWRRDFAPVFDLPAPVARLAQHAFTELLNNAVDHSGGTRVTVSVRQTPLQLQLLVSDDGCGLFDRIAGAHAIDEPRLAMAELAKGRLTTQPDRHRGHGLFFVARTADVLDLRANGAAFQHRGWDPARWHDGRPLDAAGTSVYAAFALDTTRTLEGAMREPAADPGRLDLDRTTVPMALLADADGVLESRALARRAAARLEGFREAVLDFTGVRAVGHGFADELFRVQARRGDGLPLRTLAAGPEVAAVIAGASTAA